MNSAIKMLAFGIFIIFLLFDSAVSKAESSVSSGNRAAQAHLNFRITIPETLYLQVGSLQQDAGFKSSSISDPDDKKGTQPQKTKDVRNPSPDTTHSYTLCSP